MNTTKKALITAACAVLPVLGAATAANAATTLGDTSDPATGTCSSQVIYFGGTAVSGGEGVITQWSVNRATDSGNVELVVVGAGIFEDRTVAGVSGVKNVTAHAEQTFNTRIPVFTGEQIGLWHDSDQPCYASASGHTVSRSSGTVSSPGEGTPFNLFGSVISNAKVVVKAKVEPDADGDGWGDETQDGCPSIYGVQSACPVYVPPTCKVPSLSGLTKSGAESALAKGSCKLGTVKSKKIRRFTKKKKRGRVASQSIKAGTVKPLSSIVNITVYAKKAKKKK